MTTARIVMRFGAVLVVILWVLIGVTLMLSPLLTGQGIISFTVNRETRSTAYLLDINRNLYFAPRFALDNVTDTIWSPDGSSIAVIVNDRFASATPVARLYITDSAGQGRYLVLEMRNAVIAANSAAWSPDSLRIAFALRQGVSDNPELYILHVDDGDLFQLTDTEAMDAEPAWSPDGKQLVFQAQLDNIWQLFVINTDGSDLQQLLSSPFNDNRPDWSPDGKKIVFVSDRAGSRDIYVLTLSDGSIQRLTQDPAIDSSPAWASDSRHIIFISDRDERGKWQVYLLDSHTGSIERVTDDPGNVLAPHWLF